MRVPEGRRQFGRTDDFEACAAEWFAEAGVFRPIDTLWMIRQATSRTGAQIPASS
jgi:hypothetical protein